MSRKKRKNVIDVTAAMIILDTYLKKRNNNENNKIKLINDKGEECLFDPLFTFDSEETKKVI